MNTWTSLRRAALFPTLSIHYALIKIEISTCRIGVPLHSLYRVDPGASVDPYEDYPGDVVVAAPAGSVDERCGFVSGEPAQAALPSLRHLQSTHERYFSVFGVHIEGALKRLQFPAHGAWLNALRVAQCRVAFAVRSSDVADIELTPERYQGLEYCRFVLGVGQRRNVVCGVEIQRVGDRDNSWIEAVGRLVFFGKVFLQPLLSPSSVFKRAACAGLF